MFIIKRLKKIDRKIILNFILVLSICIGSILRFYNLNWDDNQIYNPDDRKVAIMIASINIPDKLEPVYQTYNGLFIYLNRGICQILNYITQNNAWINSLDYISIVDRMTSAFVSVVSIYLIYYIAKQFLKKEYAVLTAVFATFCVGFIQQAHFGVTESFLVFELLFIVILALKVLKNNNFINWFWLGVVSGLSIGTKTSALIFLLIPYFSWLILLRKKKDKQTFYNGIYFIIITCTYFFLSSPYSILKWNDFKSAMNFESGVISGTVQVPWTIQFKNTTSLFFQLNNLIWWIGPIIPFFSFIGIIIVFYQVLLKKQSKNILPILLFTMIYFIYITTWHAKFIRYVIVILPFLLLFFCWFLQIIEKKIRKFKKLFLIFIFITIVISILSSFSFVTIYSKKNTQIEASEWIYENVENESVLLNELLDEPLPAYIENFENYKKTFKVIEFASYEPDDYEKIEILAEKLSKVDYVILSSQRFFENIMRLENDFPYTSQYYKLLFNEKLGFIKVAQFVSYPNIGPFVINDSASEETFQVFDHPTVFIFKNKERLEKSQILELLSD